MLSKQLLLGDNAPGKRKAIAYYTDLLLESKSPSGPLLADALAHLDGFWSGQRIAHATEQALEVTRDQLASAKGKADESRKLIEKLTGEDTPGTYHQKQLRQLRRATRQLEALAK